MAWRFSGRARANPGNPRAFAVCDRCGIWHNHNALSMQTQWAGTRLINLNLLVCERCLDEPQIQLKARVLPPDPEPILNARPENFDNANNTYLVDNSGNYLIANDGTYLVIN